MNSLMLFPNALPCSDKETETRVLYGKDITCPPLWKDFLSKTLKEYFAYGESDLVSLLKKYFILGLNVVLMLL